MLESSESLLPKPPTRGRLKVICAGLEADSLDELERLLATLGVDPVGRVLVTSRKVNPATYLGKGKIDEIKALVASKEAEAVIVDVELSPNQLKNLEKGIEKS